MKITAECIPCLLGRLLYETNLIDPQSADAVIKDACGILYENYSPEICSAELATQVHRRTYEILETKDPYESVKEMAMSVGLQLEHKAEELIKKSQNKLHTAILCSIVGNVLDFGIEGSLQSPDDLVANFDKIYQEDLGHDDVDKLKKYLVKGSNILFFTDNCGEIVFDKILCKELKTFDVNITIIVKGEPILSDATLKEAQQINMAEVADEMITTGHYAVGVDMNYLKPELKAHLQNADLIISKGMANFEALSETNYKPIMYILRTKCNPVADALDVPKNLNVAKFIE